MQPFAQPLKIGQFTITEPSPKQRKNNKDASSRIRSFRTFCPKKDDSFSDAFLIRRPVDCLMKGGEMVCTVCCVERLKG